jgi:hypothetical protein
MEYERIQSEIERRIATMNSAVMIRADEHEVF